MSRRARVLSPGDPAAIFYDGLLHMSQGDAEGARSVFRSIPKTADVPVILSFAVFIPALAVLLDEDQQELILRLPPSIFNDNRSNWGSSLAGFAFLRGELTRARAWADSARPELERLVRENPEGAENRGALGMMLAILGRREEAIREGERALSLRSGDAFLGPQMRHQLVRIYLAVGEQEKALDHVEQLTKAAYWTSPGWLRVDSTLTPLRSHPRFQALLKTP
jgi:tetratricopeptide (TPR) repeat protein